MAFLFYLFSKTDIGDRYGNLQIRELDMVTLRIQTILFLLLSCIGCVQEPGQLHAHLQAAATLIREEPDSALTILRGIDPESITRKATQARYALLYSQALDKNYIDSDNDSLLQIAYRYYNKRIYADSILFLVNYHYGRIYQNVRDLQQAIHHYLTAEKYALSAHEHYYLGLVYTRIGEVYSEQMNYRGMLEYYQKAYNAWNRLPNPIFQNSAMLNIANAYSSLGDNGNAVKFYVSALNLARKYKDESIIAACLSNLGTIYVNEGDYSEALRAVQEIEQLFPNDLSIYEYIILAKAYYLQHQIDSARYYFNIASGLTADSREDAQLTYLSLQIELAAGNSTKAADLINEYVRLSDSVSRMVISQSATVAEGRFYKEQTAFARYRLQVRTFMEIIAGVLIVIVAGLLIYFYRQRMKRKQEQMERYMSVIDNIRASKDRIIERLTDKEGQLKELVLSRFEILDQLGRAFYERTNTKAQQEAIYKQVKTFFTNLSSDPATKRDLEMIVNTVNEDIVIKLRDQFPKLKPADIDLLCYMYAGFSTQIISVLMNDSVTNIYTRKSRLKTRISMSEAPDKEFFIQKLP